MVFNGSCVPKSRDWRIEERGYRWCRAKRNNHKRLKVKERKRPVSDNTHGERKEKVEFGASPAAKSKKSPSPKNREGLPWRRPINTHLFHSSYRKNSLPTSKKKTANVFHFYIVLFFLCVVASFDWHRIRVLYLNYNHFKGEKLVAIFSNDLWTFTAQRVNPPQTLGLDTDTLFCPSQTIDGTRR